MKIWQESLNKKDNKIIKGYHLINKSLNLMKDAEFV